jgi:hypothetical protein
LKSSVEHESVSSEHLMNMNILVQNGILNMNLLIQNHMLNMNLLIQNTC